MIAIGLGGGCHWCTEAVFQHLRGVSDVEQGFIASHPPHDTLSEAIQLRFDPDILPLPILLAAHLSTHAATSQHTLRSRYRSAIYVPEEGLHAPVTQALEELQAEFDKPLITQVLPLERFELNPKPYHDYYLTRPDAPFCRTHIDPKLAMLRQRFAPYYEVP